MSLKDKKNKKTPAVGSHLEMVLGVEAVPISFLYAFPVMGLPMAGTAPALFSVAIVVQLTQPSIRRGIAATLKKTTFPRCYIYLSYDELCNASLYTNYSLVIVHFLVSLSPSIMEICCAASVILW